MNCDIAPVFKETVSKVINCSPFESLSFGEFESSHEVSSECWHFISEETRYYDS